VKLKLDENPPHDLATALSRHGHDVHTVVERLLRDHPLDELRGCVVVVEPQRVRIRRPEPDDPS